MEEIEEIEKEINVEEIVYWLQVVAEEAKRKKDGVELKFPQVGYIHYASAISAKFDYKDDIWICVSDETVVDFDLWPEPDLDFWGMPFAEQQERMRACVKDMNEKKIAEKFEQAERTCNRQGIY